jgi:hypothetical protein
MAKPTQNQYRPLNLERKEIRLLALEPGRGDEILRCEFQYAFLDTFPIPLYETISYVCGDQSLRATVTLQGSEARIPATSEVAIRRMRLPDRQRILWIDAVCINECDVKERGHQVGLMYAIYTHTLTNLVWLGPDDGSTAVAIDSMEVILHEMVNETPDSEELDRLLLRATPKDKSSCGKLSIDIEASALLAFYSNPWFSRLWVVQEASLAPISTYHCGNFEGPLTNVLRVASWIIYKVMQLPRIPDAQSVGLFNAKSIYKSIDSKHGDSSWGRRNAMAMCLQSFMEFATSNSKDHVYAVLGLWQKYAQAKELPSLLKPNYNLDVCTIFRDAMRYAIYECRDLLVLESVSNEEGLSLSWPSWVPRFDQELDRTLRPTRLARLFKADDLVPLHTREETDMPDTLIVSGIWIDEIAVTHDPLLFDTTAREVLALIEEVERSQHDAYANKPNAALETRIGTVLIGGVMGGIRPPSDVVLRYYQDYKKCLRTRHRFPAEFRDAGNTTVDEEKGAITFNQYFGTNTLNRAIFQSREGILGVGAAFVRSGDIIAILYGCEFPVVLRPLPQSGGLRFLGMSYVYGIMDGEAIRKHKEMNKKDSEFVLV